MNLDMTLKKRRIWKELLTTKPASDASMESLSKANRQQNKTRRDPIISTRNASQSDKFAIEKETTVDLA